MATASTDSPPTSSFDFLTPNGERLETPLEWSPALVAIDIPSQHWAKVSLTLQGQPLEFTLREIEGVQQLLACWPRCGPGYYHLVLTSPTARIRQQVRVAPAKISDQALQVMLDDLERRLPYSIAMGLQRAGGLVGTELPPPQEMTLAAEMERLRKAVEGSRDRPGLERILPELARDPHKMLASTQTWVPRTQARRPHPSRLWAALSLKGNLDSDSLPLKVLDSRVEHTYDVYENRLVKLFLQQVWNRLRRARRLTSVRELADHLMARLQRSQRQAQFLEEVRLPDHLPDRLTMVLLNRPPYRQSLEAFTEFRRGLVVRFQEPALDSPLDNLPRLYQRWGALCAIEALLRVAAEREYKVTSQNLVRRDGDSLELRVLEAGTAALELEHTHSQTSARLMLEPTYSNTRPIRSASFGQVPDLSLEVYREGRSPTVAILDPKYKLASQESAEDSEPKKVDIDKMHAYRDAIRDERDQRVVNFAAILYPGRPRQFGPGLRAIRALPGDECLSSDLQEVLSQQL